MESQSKPQAQRFRHSGQGWWVSATNKPAKEITLPNTTRLAVAYQRSSGRILARGIRSGTLTTGGLCFPESSKRTGSMQRDLEKLLEEVDEGQGFKIPDDLSRIASRINSQERYTVDMGKKGRLHLGENFERNGDEIGQTMGFVLQIEKLTLLISAARHPVQILHSDQDPKKIDTKLKTEGSGTRARSEPVTLSGIFAFMGATALHVISKSHLDVREGYDWVDAEEVIVPCGWATIFHSCLIHTGGSVRFINGRMHVYLNAKGGVSTSTKAFTQVKWKGTPPSPK